MGKEGEELLGSPTFEQMENGRFKCVETGHEMLAQDKDSYSHSKRCRWGLIDYAISQRNPPLSLFKQHPQSKSKLICKLTGDIINKTEEHIWKHINGSKFLNRLEKKESEKLASNKLVVEKDERKPRKGAKLSANEKKESEKLASNKPAVEKDERKPRKGTKLSANGEKKDQKTGFGKGIMNENELINSGSDSEEPDFWCPPTGSRWDFDDGGDRWGSGTDSGQESDEDVREADETSDLDAEELTTGTKRMAIEVGPSSFASRKKKSKNNSAADPTTD